MLIKPLDQHLSGSSACVGPHLVVWKIFCFFFYFGPDVEVASLKKQARFIFTVSKPGTGAKLRSGSSAVTSPLVTEVVCICTPSFVSEIWSNALHRTVSQLHLLRWQSFVNRTLQLLRRPFLHAELEIMRFLKKKKKSKLSDTFYLFFILICTPNLYSTDGL